MPGQAGCRGALGGLAFFPPEPIPLDRARSAVVHCADSLSAVLFPTSCPLCHRELFEARWTCICGTCWQEMKPWTGPVCSRCGIPFVSKSITPGSEYLCGSCRREDFAFDLARSYGVYTQTIRAAILELKFRRRERWGGALGGLIGAMWPSFAVLLKDQPLLVPVPLHRSRQRERGFNQAELLARGLRHALRHSGSGAAPALETRGLRRLRPTLPQSGFGYRARAENVRRVFRAEARRVRDRSVVLVDDVMTTGATASACALALKRAGAAQVIVATLARATPQFPDSAVLTS